MLENSPEAAPTPSDLEIELTAHIWNYYRDRKYRDARYVIPHLAQLSRLSLKLSEAIEREGTPRPEQTADQQLVREARQLGWSLIHRAALLEDGKGDEPVRGAQTKEPYIIKTARGMKHATVREWVRYFTEEAGDRTLGAQLQRQYDAEVVLEMKANLLASYEASKKLYNALKPRKPSNTASDEQKGDHFNQKRAARSAAQELFDELLPKAIPWPLTPKIKSSAKEALASVLVDRGNSARNKPSEAIVAIIQAATEKYLGRKVAPDLVRQAASYLRIEVKPDPIVIATIERAAMHYRVKLRPKTAARN